MAYLISDMAAGSNAALQMQQNMAAAPYVKDQAAAAAEETQLKLQQDRLKAAYAPQEMALKAQEDQARFAKTKLEATMLEAKVQTSAKTTAIEEAFAKDPENQKLSTPEYASKLAKALFAVDVDRGDKMMKFASEAEVKDALAASKKSDAEFKQIGSALASTAGATPEQFQDIVSKFSPEQQAAIEKEIPGFMQEKDPKRQKAQLENLLWTHSSATLQAKLTHDENMRKIQAESAQRIAQARIEGQIRMREISAGGKESPEAKAEKSANQIYTTGSGEIDRRFSRLEDKGQQELRDAKQELRDYENYPSKKLIAQQRVKEANDYLNKISEDRSEAYYKLAKRLPESEAKREILSGFEATQPPLPAPAKKEPDERNSAGRKPAAAVPSNKNNEGTKAAPMAMPSSAADAVDGKYYTTKAGVLKWDAKSKSFVE